MKEVYYGGKNARFMIIHKKSKSNTFSLKVELRNVT